MNGTEFFHAVMILTVIYIYIVLIYERFLNKNGVPNAPTLGPMRRAMLHQLRQHEEKLGKRDYKIVDLGSGNGMLARDLAVSLSQAQIVGLETRYFSHLRAFWIQKLAGPKNLKFLRCDFFDYDLSDCDAIVMYLRANLMAKAANKLFAELKPHTMVLSNQFPLPRIEGVEQEVIEVSTRFYQQDRLFVYKIS